MPPPLLFDISKFDLTKLQYGPEHIESVNPHRGAMRLVDGIIHETDDHLETISFKDCRSDEFWVPGHIPGRPLYPGVLMCESAAQVASYMTLRIFPDIKFIGFAALDDVKFRGQVVPGDRLLLVSKAIEVKRRRSICQCQGLVNGAQVFECTVTGMPF